MSDQGILLTSGTGEFEILNFGVKSNSYAINVIKVKEILQVEKIESIPNSPDAIIGMTTIRGEVINVVDLRLVLEKEKSDLSRDNMMILCEFNQMKIAFLVEKVLGIHRVGWDQVEKVTEIFKNSVIIGNIHLEETLCFLLDFEKIVMDISPEAGINESRMVDVANLDRSAYKLVLADDSPMIRNVLNETLRKSGIEDLTFFDNGQSAYQYLDSIAERKGDDFLDEVDILITDIEMPQMDGHYLTRKIKEHKHLKKLPVLIFSSLITADLRHKGEEVGADGQLSKPQIGDLVELIDEFAKR